MSDHNDFFEISTMFKTFLKGMAQGWNKQGFALSLTQFKALHFLSKEGPMMVSQLAAALNMTPRQSQVLQTRCLLKVTSRRNGRLTIDEWLILH